MTPEERAIEAKKAFDACLAEPSLLAYNKFHNLSLGLRHDVIGVHAREVNQLYEKVQRLENLAEPIKQARLLLGRCRELHAYGNYKEFADFMDEHELDFTDIGETKETVRQVEQTCKSN